MFPHEITPLDEKTDKKLMSDFLGERSGFCQVGKDKFVLPVAYKKHAEDYYNLPLRSDDIWVVTYPRSGTTLCQELVWMVNNNLDYETSANSSLQDRFPFLEVNTLIHDEFAQDMIDANDNDPVVADMIHSWKTPGAELLGRVASPRHVKTHLPFSLLPPKLLDTCKVFYVARNPKDVVVSYYHHNRHVKLHDYTGDFETYWNYFKNDLLVFSPYWAHVKDGWDRRHHPNLLFMYYEDIIKVSAVLSGLY
ncbi:unnamed protein product [Nesidiocoris tenuis]|uniref:Sulfotransferase domain-containing protein n=1 Tax=Nesidiocoris tenuis TaxID=355587 RepID=A0A6H5G6B9_9HEMI|nr:unnamed protein product [Nesidiocoris tenuis]